jgi:hypothetical protein
MSTAIENGNRPVMSLEAFQKTSEYLALSDLQRAWILKLVTTGDIRQATVESYPKAKRLGQQYISQLGAKNLASPHVRAALARYYGWDDKQKFLADLDAQIRRSKSADRAPLLALKAKVMLGIDAPTLSAVAAEPEQTFAVGSVVEQNGRKYEIVAREIEA